MKELRLGYFTFKNDDVLLLAGECAAFHRLADAIEQAIDTQSALAIHETADVSIKHPARLFAVGRPDRPLSGNEFHWPCNSITVEKLRSLGDRFSELSFDLSRGDSFMVSCGKAYGPEWWAQHA